MASKRCATPVEHDCSNVSREECFVKFAVPSCSKRSLLSSETMEANKHHADSTSPADEHFKSEVTFDISEPVLHDIDDSLLNVEENLRLENEKEEKSAGDLESDVLASELNELLSKCKKYAQFLFSRVQSALDAKQENPKYLTGGCLRPHQMQGLRWLRTLYEYGVNGILADEMGLGKTLQIIALICEVYALGTPGPFLIVCPLSALPQWLSEFATFAPLVPVLILHGDKEKRAVIKSSFSGHWHINRRAVHPVVITTYEVLMMEHKFFKKTFWKLLVIDEGHRIKNWRCKLMKTFKTIDTTNRFLLTGTPLQNNLRELFTLLNYLMPEIFDNSTLFDNLFRFDVCNAGIKGITKKKTARVCENTPVAIADENTVEILHQILSPFMLRRIKANILDLKLPPKTIKDVYVPMTAKQLRLQELLFKEALCAASKNTDLSTDVDEHRNSNGNIGNNGEKEAKLLPRLSQLWIQLKKVTSHPFFVDFNDDHNYTMDEIISSSGKFLALSQVLPVLCKKGHKTLIFANMLATLDYLEDMCAYLKLKTCRIDGSLSYTQRFDEVRKFMIEEEHVHVFLLSTRAAGLGLNLHAADTVIMFDSDWNPMVDEQAQDRCHRIGQTKPVLVLRFICVPSIDEQIVHRAHLKLSIEKLVVQPLRGGLESISSLASDSNAKGKGLASVLRQLREQLNPQHKDHHKITELVTFKQIEDLISR